MITTLPYTEQLERWPANGRHIMAQYDEETIVVYQAYKPAIGKPSIEHNKLHEPTLNIDRMSWIKPNFLWMMYRSGWGEKTNQEITLGLRISRAFFEEILLEAVASSFRASSYSTQEEWKEAMAASNVRLQWDPDHDPRGAKVDRRAIQLGLKGSFWHRLIRDEVIEVIDMTRFVEEQRVILKQRGEEHIITPAEEVYVPLTEAARARIKLDPWP